MRSSSRGTLSCAMLTAAGGNLVRDTKTPNQTIPPAPPSASLASSVSATAGSSLPAPPIASRLALAGIPLLGRPDLTAQPGPPTRRKIPFLGLTGSGGVSFGAYKAGYLYYLTEVAKLPANHSPIDLKLVTGASAGNIHVLFTTPLKLEVA
ncbi:MAG: hypothetical protein RMJ98_19660 [Myxococcales bacterium]|nr:hypothetical protein [Polyangiaceae bacterium]MDW8251517.1 hypothetical protein [Myxococcales bacterium]